MVQTLRALLTSGAVALLLAVPAAANPTIVPNGRGATAATDRDGVTHMAYNIPNGSAPDTVGYCRIPKGAESCNLVKELKYDNLPCEPRASAPEDEPYDNDFRFDAPQVRVTRFGEVFVLTPAFCSHGPNTTRHDMIVWTSTDAGESFDTGHQVAYLDLTGPDWSAVMSHTETIFDGADRTMVSATFNVDCHHDSGFFVQSAPLGDYTTGRALLADDGCSRGGLVATERNVAIAQRGPRSYVAAYVGGAYSRVRLFTFDEPGLPPSAVNDPSHWTEVANFTPPDTPTVEYSTDDPHLVSGPLGTFVVYRQREFDPDAGTTTNPHWLIRRVTGTTVGPATNLPQPVPGQAPFYPNKTQTWTGHAAVVEDDANGRLHFAREVPTGVSANYVQYMTSDDGTTWTPAVYLPDPNAQTNGVPAHDLGTPQWSEYYYEPALGLSTGINGFTGIVGEARGLANDNGSYARTYHPFGVLQLPYRDPPPSPGGGGDPGTPPPPPGTGGGSGGGGGGAPGGGPPAKPPVNPEDQRCKILQMGALDILADACLTEDDGVFVAKGGVSVNGLKIAGAEVRFDPKELTVKTSGPVTVSIGPSQIIKGASLNWKLPKANTFDLGALNVGALGTKLYGFKLEGAVDVKLVRGAVEVKTHLGMPGVLGGITADVTLRADNLAGLHARELWVRFPSAKLGPLELADVEFNYNPEEDAWGGTLKLTLPPNPPGPAIKATVGFRDGEITDLGGELTLPSPGIALDPTAVAWLTKIRASMHRPPLTLKGGITIGAGPLLDPSSGERSVKVDGDITITLPDSGPSTFRADGVGSVMGIPLATAYLEFVTSGQVSAGGAVKADFGPIRVEAGIGGWYYKKDFNIRGGAHACVSDLCTGGTIVFSSKGFAACADFGFVESGAGLTWGKDLWVSLINPFYLLSHIEPMPTGCDVGPYEAPDTRAKAAQAGGERTVTFGAGLPSGVVGVVGQGGAPHVALVGPDGTRVEPQANAPVRTPGAVAFQNAKDNYTWFAVKAPKAGTWKVVPEADSVPIASVTKANGLPAPKVTASVRRTSGRTRILSYNIAPLPGQTVTFTEQGAKGLGAPLGPATSKASGTLRFTPAPGPGGTRRIIALVAQRGIPRKELTVARYVAPAPPRPARPRLKVRRTGSKVVVSWAKDGVARRWIARIALSDGRVLVLLPRTPRVTVAGVAKATGGRIAVYGETPASLKGPTATATLRAVKAKAKTKAEHKR